jgi:hypothetical protein
MHRFWAVALLGGCWPAFGWGPEGHDLVARTAQAQLTSAARARINKILQPGETLVSISSWADRYRIAHPETGPWHYIDIPIANAHLNMSRDCAKDDCVVARIEQFRDRLKNPATPPAERREALLFLVHFVGDMHQPLHSSNNQDRGGNETQVVFQGRGTNLHSLWDIGLLRRMGTEDELFPKLFAESREHRKKWAKGSVKSWAEEAHKEAQEIVYGKLPKSADGAPALIDAAYEQQADTVITEQIAKAGARLARLLNSSLRQ